MEETSSEIGFTFKPGGGRIDFLGGCGCGCGGRGDELREPSAETVCLAGIGDLSPNTAVETAAPEAFAFGENLGGRTYWFAGARLGDDSTDEATEPVFAAGLEGAASTRADSPVLDFATLTPETFLVSFSPSTDLCFGLVGEEDALDDALDGGVAGGVNIEFPEEDEVSVPDGKALLLLPAVAGKSEVWRALGDLDRDLDRGDLLSAEGSTAEATKFTFEAADGFIVESVESLVFERRPFLRPRFAPVEGC